MMKLPTIEDFHVGQTAEVRKTFTDDDIRHFIAITGDENPLHIDDEFAAQTFFGRRITHGLLTASLFSTLVGMMIPGTGAIYRSQSLEFCRPVFVGETVTAFFTVSLIDTETGILTIESKVVKEDGEVAIFGVCRAGLIRRSD